MNYDNHIKHSENVKEASYFNIFECGRNVLDKLDVTYQSAFTASEKMSTSLSVPPAAAYVSPLKKILYAFTASENTSTPSSVPRATYYVSPLKKQYWDVQTNNLRKMMAGMNKDYILDAIYLLRNENPEYHESIINRLINEYDEYSISCEGDGTDSVVSDELNKILTEGDLDDWNSCLIDMEHVDRKPAAKNDPIKDTPYLKEPITKSYLGKILRQAESVLPVDMRLIHQLSSMTENPFNTETLTENPVVTELNVIGQGGSWAVIEGTHTQSIIDGRKGIIK